MGYSEEMSDWHVPYTEECKSGHEVTVFTQSDSNPEYYTEVWVKCKCGDLVKFDLPVN